MMILVKFFGVISRLGRLKISPRMLRMLFPPLKSGINKSWQQLLSFFKRGGQRGMNTPLFKGGKSCGKQLMGDFLSITGLSLLLIIILISNTPIAMANTASAVNSKQHFIRIILPAIERQNAAIAETRAKLLTLQQQFAVSEWLSRADQKYLNQTAINYGMEAFAAHSAADWYELLARVDIIPESLAIAQAANESAWGTSRFAQEGNNYFGQWCYSKGCGIVPKNRTHGASHEVRRFASLQQSVASYFRNLNSNHAYQHLREIRANLRAQEEPVTGVALTAGLINYSERGQQYVNILRQMIHNNPILAAIEGLHLKSRE